MLRISDHLAIASEDESIVVCELGMGKRAGLPVEVVKRRHFYGSLSQACDAIVDRWACDKIEALEAQSMSDVLDYLSVQLHTAIAPVMKNDSKPVSAPFGEENGGDRLSGSED